MSRSTRVGRREAGAGALGEERVRSVAGLVAQAAAGAAVQDQVGEGSGGHRARIVREGPAIRPAGRMGDRPPQGGAAAMAS